MEEIIRTGGEGKIEPIQEHVGLVVMTDPPCRSIGGGALRVAIDEPARDRYHIRRVRRMEDRLNDDLDNPPFTDTTLLRKSRQ